LPTSPEITSQPAPGDSYTAGLVTLAKTDLASRLNVSAGEIELVSFESITWPDGGLGCPQPGIAYIQVQVEGYRILLSHKGAAYPYHGGGRRGPFLCENESYPPGKTPSPGLGNS
jgi:hypothetical protein